MKLRVLLTAAALLGPHAAQAQSAADPAAAARQELARCGVTARETSALELAAQEVLRGAELGRALSGQGYRPHDARGWRLTFGDLAGLRRAVQESCAPWRGLGEYGLSVSGNRLALIAATPARVDLTQSRRWLGEFLAATNRARLQGQRCGAKLMNAAPALTWDTRLEAAAARQATDLVRLDFRGHVNPRDGSGPLERAAASGFRGSVGENLSYGPVTPQEAVQSLLGSPGHCENLMNPAWTLFGGAVNNGTADTLFATYWVQVFGAP
ncbi:CAP domain-containing protein [Deinococcus petrolearius]|uniref:CAP domain-containing protein n=1 Tax=Deinococcus petrolearius TaxID=1751295 RepID=A0ABW1DPP1_9DEIO